MSTGKFSLETALQTNGVTKSDMKQVIKKQLENVPKRKGGEKKMQMMKIGLIRLMLGHHEFIFS